MSIEAELNRSYGGVSRTTTASFVGRSTRERVEAHRDAFRYLQKLAESLGAENVALVAPGGLFLEPRREIGGGLRERAVGRRKPLARRVVTLRSHRSGDLAAEIRREAREVARCDLGNGTGERRRQVLADMRHLGEGHLFLLDQARRSLGGGRVVAVNVVAYGKERLVALGRLVRRVHVDELEALRTHPRLQLGQVERVVVPKGSDVDRRQIGYRLREATGVLFESRCRHRRDLSVVFVQPEIARVGRIVGQ